MDNSVPFDDYVVEERKETKREKKERLKRLFDKSPVEILIHQSGTTERIL